MQNRAAPRFQGKIRVWKDEQGFGFIAPNGGGANVFVHIKSFSTRGVRPAENDVVTFQLGRNEKGQARAEQVAFAQVPASRQGASGNGGLAVGAALLFMFAIALAVLLGKLPAAALGVYAGLSLLTFFIYAWDKSAAQNNRWRTPEDTLHLLALLGGWPGALVAQQTLRHKSRKQSFRAVFRLTVGLNCAALLWLCTASGAAALRALLAGA